VEVRGLPSCAPELPAGDAPLEALAQRFRVETEALDGWTIATNLTRSGCRIVDPGLRYYAERLAARAVLQKAARLVGPLRVATRTVSEPMLEPWGGELDVEATVENLLGKPHPEPADWIVRRRVDRRHQVVLMVDTSLSMSGEYLAIAAVAAAVLALKLHPEDLSLVVFEDTARCATHLDALDPPDEVVRRMLDQPVRGYTNIEAALELGAAELERGRNPRRSGLLITDGVVTAGGDPRPLAHRFPHLVVLLTEDYKMNPELCRELADAGRGDVFPVRAFRDLPARLLEVANRILR
jgi:Mg-chelatase subunit ChlD